jgi:hypothetical protein
MFEAAQLYSLSLLGMERGAVSKSNRCLSKDFSSAALNVITLWRKPLGVARLEVGKTDATAEV